MRFEATPADHLYSSKTEAAMAKKAKAKTKAKATAIATATTTAQAKNTGGSSPWIRVAYSKLLGGLCSQKNLGRIREMRFSRFVEHAE